MKRFVLRIFFQLSRVVASLKASRFLKTYLFILKNSKNRQPRCGIYLQENNYKIKETTLKNPCVGVQLTKIPDAQFHLNELLLTSKQLFFRIDMDGRRDKTLFKTRIGLEKIGTMFFS